MLAAEKLGYFRGCPGLTRKAINNHLGIETASEKGWMTQVRQGAHTTRSPVAVPDETNNECTAIPQQEPGNSKTHEVYFTATNAGGGLVYSDQTGRFPCTSNRSNKYLAIFYVYNVKALLYVPIKSRAKEELLRAYKKIYSYLEARGFKLKLHKLDNETSTDVEEFITAQQAKYQYTPPDMHRSNAAERGVQTYDVPRQVVVYFVLSHSYMELMRLCMMMPWLGL